jgi:hypothetical protein
MMVRDLAGFILACALALAPGCTPLVTIEAPDIEVTQSDLRFAAAPRGTSIIGTFVLNTSKLGASSKPDAATLKMIDRLELTRVVLNAKAGITDFAFLDHLTVQAANWTDAASQNPPKPVIEIIDHRPHDGDLIGATLPFPLSPPIDMLPVWKRSILYITVTATGDMPKVDWSMDVIFSLSIKLTQ